MFTKRSVFSCCVETDENLSFILLQPILWKNTFFSITWKYDWIGKKETWRKRFNVLLFLRHASHVLLQLSESTHCVSHLKGDKKCACSAERWPFSHPPSWSGSTACHCSVQTRPRSGLGPGTRRCFRAWGPGWRRCWFGFWRCWRCVPIDPESKRKTDWR